MGDVRSVKNGNVVHIAAVYSREGENSLVTVEGLSGLETTIHIDPAEPAPQGAWRNPDATVEYYRK